MIIKGDNGERLEIEDSEYNLRPFYYVYVLMKKGLPIYVGMTGNLEKRMQQHKNDKSKDWDTYTLVYQRGYKDSAAVAETAVMTLCKRLNPHLHNKKGFSPAIYSEPVKIKRKIKK